MGIYSWDIGGGFSFSLPAPSPLITIRCEYLGLCPYPVEITFGLSPRYGIRTAREAHDWFLKMMSEHYAFEVETDRAGEPPLPFCSETVRQVLVE